MKALGGVTPLMKAADSLSVPTVIYLLEIGSDPWAIDDYGRTAKYYAAAVDPTHKIVVILEQAEIKSSQSRSLNDVLH